MSEGLGRSALEEAPKGLLLEFGIDFQNVAIGVAKEKSPMPKRFVGWSRDDFCTSLRESGGATGNL